MSTRDDLAARIASLPPEKLALFLNRIEAQRAEEPCKAQLVIPTRHAAEPRALSLAQQRLWVLEQIEPGNVSYNIASAVRLRGVLSVDILIGTFDEILRRHEVLRSTFVNVDGKAQVVVSEAAKFALAEADLSSLAPAERERALHSIMSVESLRPFDLARGPLIRGLLVKVVEEEHILLLSMHHMVSDGWSDSLFLSEFAALYTACMAGLPSPLEDLLIQYGDYASWQRGWLAAGVLDDQLTYWLEKLAGSPPILDLPTDHPRPTVLGIRGRSRTRSLPSDLARGTLGLCKQENVTLFIFLLAVFDVLLYRYSGQEDFNVGTPVAGRHHHQIEGLIGFFVNTLVMRDRCRGKSSFRRFLAEVRETVLEALAHQDLPFENLVNGLELERSLSYSPVFQVMFSVDEPFNCEERLGRLAVEPVEVEVKAVQFDLDVTVCEEADGLRATFDYSTELFQSSTVHRMILHFEHLLRAILVDPDQCLGMLPLLSSGESHQLLRETNDSARAWDSGASWVELFEAQVSRVPEAMAATCGSVSVSYRGLAERSGTLARKLAELGVGPERVVALLAPRSIDFLTAIVGVFKAGGAYLPLDPAHPPGRHRKILARSGAALLLSAGGLEGLARKAVSAFTEPPRVTLLEEVLHGEPAGECPRPGHHAGQLAYILFTSGSTGTPKGVMIPHRGMVNHLWANIEALGMTPRDVLAQTASQCFDISVWQFLTPLILGGRVEIFDDELTANPPELLRAVDHAGVTIFETVPSLLQLMLSEGTAPPALQALRWLLPTGEALPADLVRKWFGRYPKIPLMNAYGPSECSDDVTLEPMFAPPQGSVSIGRPVGNLRLHVLDEEQSPVPVGAVGEMYVGGAGVGRGYLGQPGRTASVFLPDPVGGEPGLRLYRTGDLGRQLKYGRTEYVRRTDFQVKLRGRRIELEEIESALAEHGSVRESVVVVREDRPGEPRLVGYVVVSEGEPSASVLRAHLLERLPKYMVPSALVFLEALPLSPNGKLDRRALPAPDFSRPDPETAVVAPRTREEEALHTIWTQLLGSERFGIFDNFFSLGGDSILSLQMIARANQAGLQLTSRQVFQHQTIAALAEVAGKDGGGLSEQAAVTGPVPLTPIQRWFFEESGSRLDHYNQAVMVKIRRKLPAELLQRTVEHLWEHHDALRMRFDRAASGFRQVCGPVTPFAGFSRVDLSALAPDARHGRIEACAAGLQEGFELSRGPLVRVALFELGDGRADRLLIVAHHLVIDGMSWRILLEDLEHALAQLVQHQDVALPPRTTSFKTWAETLVEHARSPELAAEADFWIRLLDLPAAPLPVDGAGGAATMAGVRTVTVSLEPDETRRLLREVPKAYRTEINDVLLSALVRSFAAWSGQSHLLVDLEGHGREEVRDGLDVSRTVGWFATVYPVPLVAGDPARPWEALKANKELLRSIPTHGIGYWLLRYLGPEEIALRLQELPAAQVLFEYLGQFDQTLGESSTFSSADESVGATESPHGRRSHLFELNGGVFEGCLQMEWAYHREFHRRETVERLAEGFVAELRSLIAHCTSEDAGGYTPSDFPLASLDDQTLEAVVGERRDVEDILPLTWMQQGILFHTLFAPRSEVFFEQLSCTLEGPLDVAVFRRAWREVVARHGILRTSFAWDAAEEPLQVVSEHAELPWREEDWRGLEADLVAERFGALLAADRQQGFDLGQAPLMRVTLVCTSPNEYRFLWSRHHLLLDGWSDPLLLQEVFTLYASYATGRPVVLEKPRPFRDYLAWLCRQQPGRAESFWRRKLSGFTRPTRLRPDRAAKRMPGQSEGYAEHLLELPEGTTASLELLAREHRLTLNTLVQGAWALLLSRYSGDNDVLFGATVAGRPPELEGVESILGLFINTLPVRVRTTARAELLPWLGELQDQQAEVRQYEHTPLVRIREWSQVPQDMPLFDTLLVFENYPVDESLSGLELGVEISDVTGYSKPNYPFTLLSLPGPRLTFLAKYDPGCFERGEVGRILGHLEVLLGEFVRRQDGRLREIELLTADERRQLLHDWNATAADYPAESSLQELFERQASEAPEAVALCFEDDVLTYGQLNRRANRLAHRLRQAGVVPEERVALCFERSFDLATGILGVLKAGGAFVALAPDLPRDRLAHILEETRPRLLLTREPWAPQLPELACGQLFLDRTGALSDDASNPPPSAGSGNLAYVVYTSGSTGRPKGVLIRQRGVLSHFAFLQRQYGLGPGDVVLQIAPVTFDAAVRDLIAPLTMGARVVLLRDKEAKVPELLLRAALRHRVSRLMSIVPTLLRGLIEAGDGEAAPTTLRSILASGEVLDLGICHGVRKLLGADLEIVNQYGATECTMSSVFHPVPPESPARGPAALGKPNANSSVYVLDPEVSPVPVGVAGEVHLGGVGLARGYLGRPALTAEKLIPHPFASEPGRRLYKTGDLARQSVDGNLEYLGRKDHQVQVRGFRVEPEETEAVLGENPELNAAVVVGRELERGETVLVAYVVPAGPVAPTTSELHDYCRHRLPEYMVPTFFVPLGELPRTRHGKVDRRALPAPDQQRPMLVQAYVAPRDDVESRLAEVWTAVLGVERIGIHDNFFELGGHSLRVIQVISRVRRGFGVELPLKRLFETPTIAAIAAEISRVREGESEAAPAEILPVARQRRRMKRSQLQATGRPAGSHR